MSGVYARLLPRAGGRAPPGPPTKHDTTAQRTAACDVLCERVRHTAEQVATTAQASNVVVNAVTSSPT